ncbi:MAG: 50S ribosomal protein L31 [Planctomycetes bacterium]|nr:50S ribosomal protein L31 [Planctomycetota bacterium]
MKKGIHPEYNEVQVTCGCGNSFTTRSTRTGRIAVEICAACHPFYTGKQKFVDTAGMVEKFQRKWAGEQARQAQIRATSKKPALPKSAPAARSSKTLQSQLPGAGPATLSPAIGQKAAQKPTSPGSETPHT